MTEQCQAHELLPQINDQGNENDTENSTSHVTFYFQLSSSVLACFQVRTARKLFLMVKGRKGGAHPCRGDATLSSVIYGSQNIFKS